MENKNGKNENINKNNKYNNCIYFVIRFILIISNTIMLNQGQCKWWQEIYEIKTHWPADRLIMLSKSLSLVTKAMRFKMKIAYII